MILWRVPFFQPEGNDAGIEVILNLLMTVPTAEAARLSRAVRPGGVNVHQGGDVSAVPASTMVGIPETAS